MARLTLITSLYNCADFVKYSIQSGIEQNFQDFNWIIVNDGSPDNISDVVEPLIDDILDKVILWCNYPDNKGIGYRFNEAIKRAETEYVAIFDGDDIYYPIRLSSQLKYLDIHKHLFACGTYAHIINEKGTIDFNNNYGNSLPIISNDIYPSLKNHNNPFIHPSMMMRRNIFLDLNGYNEKEWVCPDLDLWCRAINEGYFMENLPYTLMQYRIHPKALSQLAREQMFKDAQRIYKKYGY